MLIRVVYQNYKHDLVKPSLLNKLILSGQVKKFLRSDGWATIGIAPMRRKDVGRYIGIERRNNAG